ncbi:hypothetical protein scyTo_0017026, partial [Scyliorhinus torazame]|nr:hypothetical protein [Scyliorhinus torazame]
SDVYLLCELGIQSDVYLLCEHSIQSDVYLLCELSIQSDVYLLCELISSDVYLICELVIQSDVYLLCELSIQSDVYLLCELSIQSDVYLLCEHISRVMCICCVSTVSSGVYLVCELGIQSDVYVLCELGIQSDVYLLCELSIQIDVYLLCEHSIQYVHLICELSIQNDVYLLCELCIQSDVYLLSEFGIQGDVYLLCELSIQSDVYLLSEHSIRSDVYLLCKLCIQNDVYLLCDLSIQRDVYLLCEHSVQRDVYLLCEHKPRVTYVCSFPQDQMASDPSVVDMFLTGSSFTDWFTTFVNNVTSGRYPIIRDQIFRYIHDERCVAQTGDIIISVSTSFLPELSSVHPPHYFFSYRIRIEMVKDASPDDVCQLDSRYWKITNENGDVEEVQGSGVVGEFPVLHPGTVHEYTSCTTFTTPLGYMEGYYTFHHLSRKRTTFNVAIPRFYMQCLPSRASTAHQNGRSLDPSRDDTPPSDCNDRQNPNLFVNFPAALGRCPRHT